MKLFTCKNCESNVFFENNICQNCGSQLGFIPQLSDMLSFSIASDGAWSVLSQDSADNQVRYKPCANYSSENICNWMLDFDDNETYCQSCRHTDIIPTLNSSDNKNYWFLLEVAKRRLFYSLMILKLPIPTRNEQPETGLVFHFKEDGVSSPDEKILTGHDSGIITINIAEADDVIRESRRKSMHEPYRTLLGHLRHESGHFYWDQLILNSKWLQSFRDLFGDERIDYSEALEQHYKEGVPKGWETSFVSGYATSHPWEDWAETWAHYLHITDALETAKSGRRLFTNISNAIPQDIALNPLDFRRVLIEEWAPLSQFLNSMSRSLGHKDPYPFLMPDPVVSKLCFIDNVIHSVNGS